MKEIGVIKFIAEDQSHGYLIPLSEFDGYWGRENTYGFNPVKEELLEKGDLICYEKRGKSVYFLEHGGEVLLVPDKGILDFVYLFGIEDGAYLNRFWVNDSKKPDSSCKARVKRLKKEGHKFYLNDFETMESSDSFIEACLNKCFTGLCQVRNFSRPILKAISAYFKPEPVFIIQLLHEAYKGAESEIQGEQPKLNHLADLFLEEMPSIKGSFWFDLNKFFARRDDFGVEKFKVNFLLFLKRETPYLVFDLEIRREEIVEFAALGNQESTEILFGNYSKDEFGEKVIGLLSGSEILIGHNIEQFDLPKLEGQLGLDFSDRDTYDTLLWEVILNPSAPSYALDTAHSALKDAEKTQALFINQLCRLVCWQTFLMQLLIYCRNLSGHLYPIIERIIKKFTSPLRKNLQNKRVPFL